MNQLSRFLATGVLNTIAGYAIIFSTQYLTKNPFLANTLGFALGTIISYYNHSRYTFQKKVSVNKGAVYSVISLACFCLNLIVLKMLLTIVNPWLSQFLSVLTYIISNYVLVSRFVFHQRPQ